MKNKIGLNQKQFKRTCKRKSKADLEFAQKWLGAIVENKYYEGLSLVTAVLYKDRYLWYRGCWHDEDLTVLVQAPTKS